MSLIRFQLVIRRYLRQNKCNVISHVPATASSIVNARDINRDLQIKPTSTYKRSDKVS